MCRHLLRLGAPVGLADLLYGPPHSLEVQSYAPRLMNGALLNADGWGVGWYEPAIRPEPARYRTATPMWADRRFADIAPLLRSGCILAAVRSATPPAPVEETGAAPFAAGRLLFSHNGYLEGFRDGIGEKLRRTLSERRAAGILGATDSEVLFALLLDRLDDGAPLEQAVAEVVATADGLTGGKLNLLVTDGTRVVATRWGHTLFTRTTPDAVVVASEPLDDEAWTETPERALVVGDHDGLRVEAL